MKTKQTTVFAMLALVFGVAISPILLADNAEARLSPISHVVYGDLTSPNGEKPFGGDTVGNYNIHIRDDRATIYAEVDHVPSNGMIFEGWLVDVQSGEKTSTGTLKQGVVRGFFYTDANFSADVFVITEEPFIDSDPAPNKPVAGVPLSAPFGQ